MDRARRGSHGQRCGDRLGSPVRGGLHDHVHDEIQARSARGCRSRNRLEGWGTAPSRHQAGEISDFAGATKTFEQVLALDPGNKLAWYNLGVIAQHDDNTDAARTAYDNSLKTDPAFESALYNKAILLGSSDTDQAIAILQRIVAANPKAATAYLQLGQDQLKKGQDSEAKDAFGRAVRTDPSLQELVPERFRDSVSAATTQPRNRTQTPTPTPTPTPTATQAGTSR